MDFNFLLMAAENTAEMTDKQIMGSTVIALLMFFGYPIWLIIKWFRQHPIVNMRKLSDRLDRAAMLKERMRYTSLCFIFAMQSVKAIQCSRS